MKKNIDNRNDYYLQTFKFVYNIIMEMRNSNQRKIVLDVMNENYSHPTADEIYEKARIQDSHISKGTVYRNLNILWKQGLVKKVSVPNGSDHYDFTLKEHYHFWCKNCQKIFDAPDNICVKIENAVSTMVENGFSVNGHDLLFTGLCPDCNKQN